MEHFAGLALEAEAAYVGYGQVGNLKEFRVVLVWIDTETDAAIFRFWIYFLSFDFRLVF